METYPATSSRIQARDAALRLLNRLTAGVAFTAVAGVGVLGLVGAQTIPGTATTSSTSSTTTSTSTTTSSTTSGGLQSTSAPTSTSSGGGVVVSGGS